MTNEPGRSSSKGASESSYSASTSSKGASESSYAASKGGQGQQQSAMNSARDSISSAASDAGTKVAAGINSQKSKAAEGLGSVAQALRQSGETLRSKDPDASIPQYISSAADQVERLSGYLRSSSVSDMVNGLEQFARSQPALFIGSAFMLGLLGARFLKSSGRSDAGNDQGSRSAQYPSTRQSYPDPRTSAGYWRAQEARDTMNRSEAGGSRTGEEPF